MAERFQTTCEARRPDLSLFIQTRFNGSLYNQRLGMGEGGGEAALRALFCSLKSCHEQPS